MGSAIGQRGEKMDELISRQAAIDYFVTNVGFHDEDCYPIEDTDELRKIWTEYFSGIPSAQPKRGKWIDKGERGDWEWQADGRGRHWHEWECNTCHHYFAERSFFCPHCGSDMREVTT